MIGRPNTPTERLYRLQDIDLEIREVQSRIQESAKEIENLRLPAKKLEEKTAKTAERLAGLEVEDRRLERAIADKHRRIAKLEKRLNGVQNVREESAVRSELGTARRAVDQEELDQLSLGDQISRLEGRLGEERTALKDAIAAIEPNRKAIEDSTANDRSRLTELTERREKEAETIDRRHLQIYDNLIRSGRKAVVRMTADGACGDCFSMIPLQVQNEIQNETREDAPPVLCEACGVIIAAPDAE